MKKTTIFVRWVRSAIGFSAHQKSMVRSLGLRRLNQTVELQDTLPVRGLVARIPHLVEIVKAPAAPPLASIPEYSVRAGEAPAGVAPRRRKKIQGSPPEAPSTAEGSQAADSAGGV